MGTKVSEEPATPNMEAAGSFEMLVPVHQTTGLHMPEDFL